MKKIFLIFVLFPLFIFSFEFIQQPENLENYYYRKDVVMVASPGRSGSTLLSELLCIYAINYKVLKTHILPPNRKFIGKIIFIFSNPDKAAESILHIILNNVLFGALHFYHLQSSDKEWLKKIGETSNQNIENNLLAYDALGCEQQLAEWLYQTVPCDVKEAQILAIKYEFLWDPSVIIAIKNFLNLDIFELPPQKVRGYELSSLCPNEILFRKIYNLGTDDSPKYKAYDKARILWEAAPPFRYLKLNP